MTPEQAAAIREKAGWGDPIWGQENYVKQIKEQVNDPQETEGSK